MRILIPHMAQLYPPIAQITQSVEIVLFTGAEKDIGVMLKQWNIVVQWNPAYRGRSLGICFFRFKNNPAYRAPFT